MSVDFKIVNFMGCTLFMVFFIFKQNMVRNPKKILTEHELNQVVK